MRAQEDSRDAAALRSPPSPTPARLAALRSCSGSDKRASQYVEDPGNHVILIVDDDPTNVHVLETLLTHEGFVTVSADTGFKALEIFAQAVPKPSCVLLDIGLPDISGARPSAFARKKTRFGLTL